MHDDVGALIDALGSQDMSVHSDAYQRLSVLGREIIEPLIEALGHESYWVRGDAIQLLGATGDPRIIAPLMQSLLHEEGELAGEAAKILKPLGGIDVPLLVASLSDPDPRVRANAAYCLQWVDDLEVSSAIEPLVSLASDPDENVRRLAAMVMGSKSVSAGVPALVKLLGAEQPHQVRWQAVNSLKHLKDPRAVEPLLALLDDPDESLQQEAIVALGATGDLRALEPLMSRLLDGVQASWVASALKELPDLSTAVGRLVALLDHRDPNQRKFAADILGSSDDARAVVKLMAVLEEDPADFVRESAAWSLGELEDPRAADPLLAALRDPSDRVRRAAAFAFTRIKDPRAVDALLAMLDDPGFFVRDYVVKALGAQSDPRAVEPLRSMLAAPGDLYGVLRDSLTAALHRLERGT